MTWVPVVDIGIVLLGAAGYASLLRAIRKVSTNQQQDMERLVWDVIQATENRMKAELQAEIDGRLVSLRQQPDSRNQHDRVRSAHDHEEEVKP